MGQYILNITVIDTSQNMVFLSYHIVIVDEKLPTISSPDDIRYNYGENGQKIEWQVSDNYPDAYVVYRNGIQISAGAWTNDFPVTVFLINLQPGTYNYTLLAFDSSGNQISDSVDIMIIPDDPTPPTIDGIESISFTETDNISFSSILTWVAVDDYAWNYTIYVDGVIAIQNTWQSGIAISYSYELLLENNLPGVYNITILFWDYKPNSASLTTLVTIEDNIIPKISSNDNLAIQEGESTVVEWTLNDNNPNQYYIYLNGSLLETNVWIDNQKVSYNFDMLSYGTYNITFVLYDKGNNQNTQTIIYKFKM